MKKCKYILTKDTKKCNIKLKKIIVRAAAMKGDCMMEELSPVKQEIIRTLGQLDKDQLVWVLEQLKRLFSVEPSMRKKVFEEIMAEVESGKKEEEQ